MPAVNYIRGRQRPISSQLLDAVGDLRVHRNDGLSLSSSSKLRQGQLSELEHSGTAAVDIRLAGFRHTWLCVASATEALVERDHAVTQPILICRCKQADQPFASLWIGKHLTNRLVPRLMLQRQASDIVVEYLERRINTR